VLPLHLQQFLLMSISFLRKGLKVLGSSFLLTYELLNQRVVPERVEGAVLWAF